MLVYIDNNRQHLKIPRWSKTLTNIHFLYSKMQLNFMVASNYRNIANIFLTIIVAPFSHRTGLSIASQIAIEVR